MLVNYKTLRTEILNKWKDISCPRTEGVIIVKKFILPKLIYRLKSFQSK